MPSIKLIEKILKQTPNEQAVLIEGIHGVGKSEVIKAMYEKEGYNVVVFFLGQTADSGDIIGLPNRKTIQVEINGQMVDQVITEHAPPKWWPFNENDKVCVLLDEFNRGKPEVYQCVFDMVLNRKLNGMSLPEHTRIIALMNPSGSDFDYDVVEMDKALLDRFNKYAFEPTVDEWVDYATKTKVHKHIISFILKNGTQLDPPMNIETEKMNEVYPSRRSWIRVSDLVKSDTSLLEDKDKFFSTMLYGIIGHGATGMFIQHLKEVNKGISPSSIVYNWTRKLEAEIKALDNTDWMNINKELAFFMAENFEDMKTNGGKACLEYTKNIKKYLDIVPSEIGKMFLDQMIQANNETRDPSKSWGYFVLEHNPDIGNMFQDWLKK